MDDLDLDDVAATYPDFLVRHGFEGAGWRAHLVVLADTRTPAEREMVALTLGELVPQMDEVRAQAIRGVVPGPRAAESERIRA